MSSQFLIRKAEPADGVFLSIGVREAERCHAGVGIYDALLAKKAENITPEDRAGEDDVSRYLKHSVLNDPAAHIYYGRFLVAVDSESGKLAGCTCSFPYPECGLSKSIPGFTKGIVSSLNYTTEETEKFFDRWNFLDSAFPDVEYNNTWMLESVFVDPAFRKLGLGELLLTSVMENMRKQHTETEQRRFLITCAVGNEPAKRLYERVGFHVVGNGDSEACMQTINCRGFYVLSA